MLYVLDFTSFLHVLQSLPFGGVKDSGFGRFAGIEGLRACCLVKSVVEDRWWPLVKTKIPKPIQVRFRSLFLEMLTIWSRVNISLPIYSTLFRRTASSSKNRSWKLCIV